MKVAIHAVGRMKAGPEREIVERYHDRVLRAGRSLGLDVQPISEIAESPAAGAAERKREEGARLLAGLDERAALVILDERGRNLASADFAQKIAGWRDEGRRGTVFAIGGPDGHDEAVRARADLTLAFGALTWPHQLVRIMLAEQLYRAVTILSGHPYHRV